MLAMACEMSEGVVADAANRRPMSVDLPFHVKQSADRPQAAGFT